MIKNTFRRDTIFYGIAILVDRLVGFLILPLLARGLSQTDFGVWSQIQTVYGFLSTALLLGFYHTVSSLIANRNEFEVNNIFKGILLIVLLASFSFSSASLLFSDSISTALFADNRFSGLIPVFVWFSVTEAIFELIVLGYLRAKHLIPQCAIFLIVKSALRFLAVWVGLYENTPLISMLGMIGIANIIIVAVTLKQYIFRSTLQQLSKLNLDFWSSAMLKSFGIAMAVFMAWGCLAANRFLIVHFLGLHAVAIYSANYSLLSVTTFVPMILTFTLLHHMSVLMAKRDVDSARVLFKHAINYYLYITLPLLVLITTFYPLIIRWIAPGYEVAWNLQFSFVIYFFLFGLEQLFIFSIFAQINPKVFFIRLLAFLLSMACGFFLIPRYGIEFSVWPLCAVSVMIIYWCFLELKKAIDMFIDWKKSIWIFLAALVMTAIGIFVMKGIRVENLYVAVATMIFMIVAYLLIEAYQSDSLTRTVIKMLCGWRYRAG